MNKIKDIGFHGHHRNHYFEGWYFKTVLSESNITLALIPGLKESRRSARIHSSLHFSSNDIQIHPF